MNGVGFNGSTVTFYGILIRMFFDNRTPLTGSWRRGGTLFGEDEAMIYFASSLRMDFNSRRRFSVVLG